jgi:CheY-like chemotaxis protein
MVATAGQENPLTVLLVEDDPDDQTLVQRAFRLGHVPVDLQIVNDGQEAMDYLLNQGEFADLATAPSPDLVLLDLNMPNLGGHDLLKLMQAQPPRV